MKLYLHIGIEKTGTSSIQSFFDMNRQEILKKYGLLYPRVGQWSDKSHHNLAFSVLKSRVHIDNLTSLDDLIEDLKNEIVQTGCKSVLISSEIFRSLHHTKYFDDFNLRLKEVFSEIELVIFLRDQAYWLQSMYNQLIKDPAIKYKKNFSDFCIEMEEKANYFFLLEKWMEFFPKQNMHILRYYEKNDSRRTSSVQQILNLLKIEFNDFKVVKDRNISLNNTQLFFLKMFNEADLSDTVYDKARLAVIHGLSAEENSELITQDEIKEIRDKYSSSNNLVAVDFFGEDRLFPKILIDNKKVLSENKILSANNIAKLISCDIEKLDEPKVKINNIALSDKSFDIMKECINKLLDVREYQLSELLLSQLLSNNTLSLNVKTHLYYLQATLETRKYSFPQAFDFWQQAYNVNKDFFPSALGYAKSCLESNYNELASNLYNKLLDKGIEHEQIYSGLAKTNLRIHPYDYATTLSYLDKAIKLSNSDYISINLMCEKVFIEYTFLGESVAFCTINVLGKEFELTNYTSYFKYYLKSLPTSNILSDIHDDSFNIENIEIIEKTIQKNIESKIPASFIRLGDGEGRVLSRDNKNLLGATGTKNRPAFKLSDIENELLLKKLNKAVESADILGLPNPKLVMHSNIWKMLVRGINAQKLSFWDNSQHRIITDWLSHYHLFFSGALERIIIRQKLVYYIGCHNLDEYFNHLGVDESIHLSIPGEQLYNLNMQEQPHYPVYYNEIIESIKNIPEGSLVLVGAGVLGKIYCQEVKAVGSIAIDIGAVMDLLAKNTSTRHTTRFPAVKGYCSIDSIKSMHGVKK